MQRNSSIIVILSLIAVISFFFFFSFTEFQTVLVSNDVVTGDEVFITTDKTAVDNFMNRLHDEQVIQLQRLQEEEQNYLADVKTQAELEQKNFQDHLSEIELKKKTQALGVGVFITLKDSNGNLIPQESKLLPVNSIFLDDSTLLDFAKIQFDIVSLLLFDDNVQSTVKFDLVSNGKVFSSGVAFADGKTVDGKINYKFESGSKIGDAYEVNVGNDIPVIASSGGTINTFEIKIKNVSALVGDDFNTRQFNWSGDFPVYTLKFIADDSHRTIRDFTGTAIMTLPNDIGIYVCGNDDGRVKISKTQSVDIPVYAPKILVYETNGDFVMESDQPNWGSRDADFNSYKCSVTKSGLDRNHNYIFKIDSANSNGYEVSTPSTSMSYYAKCTNTGYSNTCESNFGWK